MRRPTRSDIVALITLAVCCWFVLPLSPVYADSLSLLTDLQYDVINTETTDKNMNNAKTKNERAAFSQLYNLEIQKEIFPTLKLNAGGLFDQDSSRTKIEESGAIEGSESRNTTIRPFFDLQFTTSMLAASAGYRKRSFKESPADGINDRTFTEEYSSRINWDPVGLPEVDLYFTRTLAYNEPLTNDQQIDNYQLRSKYGYKNFAFTFNHTTNDVLNKQAEFKTLTNFDDASIRFFKTYWQGKLSVNSSLRGNRQQSEFSGTGDRLAPTTSLGVVIGNSTDPTPITSDPDIGFALTSVDLLVDSLVAANQLSFGLDFGSPTELDRLFINVVDLGTVRSSDFSWAIYIRDNDTENWSQVTPVQNTTSISENRFELSFASLKTRYIKIVTTPLAPPAVTAGKDLLISSLVGWRTLPPDTSEFISTDWTGDLNLNWTLNEKTLLEYNMLYREQRSDPLGEKKTLLSTGAGLRHTFNDVFVGNMRVQRSESRERGEQPNTNHNYSAALMARYLDTFNQSLTYSFSHQNDEESQTTISNAIFLRNNLDLYQGWSMFLDNGYSWQNPAEGESFNTTFVRVGSNIVPNRWLNTTLSYGVSWVRESGKPVSRDQDGRVAVSWVPTSTLSLSADFAFTDKTGEEKDSTAEQEYSINWSPLRDGTLLFSLAYAQSEDDDDKKSWNLSPTLRWQINRKTVLSFDYSTGERDDRNEVVEFESIGLALRIFY